MPGEALGLAEAGEADVALLGKMQLLARKLAEDLGIAGGGFRVVANSGPNSGQEVAHLHYHLLGGEQLGDIV